MHDRHWLLQRHLPEQLELEELMIKGDCWLRSRVIREVDLDAMTLPVSAIEMGSRNPRAPVLGLFGGVHGVERIGSQILLYWLHTLIERLKWDDALHRRLEQVRLVMVPMVNPGGILRRTRCNPNGVDLMRNAPVDADGPAPWLVGGHRLTRKLPWYRGPRGAPMEPEAQAVVELVRSEIQSAPFSLTLDCHSGFGRMDRLWCCYAKSHRPIPHLAEFYALKKLRESTFPHHHPYLIEPQSVNYTTHGDLWDFLYDESLANNPDRIFLPLTLEMGSWLWVRKNPRQMFDFFGYFNPIIGHRHSRVLRQHIPLLEFLMGITNHWHLWTPGPGKREKLEKEALQLWFSNQSS